jgi:hypothetical protein
MKISKNVRAMISGQGAIIRDLRRGGSFGLNPLGAKVWKLLQQSMTTEQIIDQISVDFKTSRETVENDVREFIQKLEEQKLIVREESAVAAN